jgi:hypothetical protein
MAGGLPAASPKHPGIACCVAAAAAACPDTGGVFFFFAKIDAYGRFRQLLKGRVRSGGGRRHRSFWS